MTTQRQGEIAVKLVKYFMCKHGIKLSQDNMREFGNIAKAIGVPVEELKQFARPIIQEVLDGCFGSSNPRSRLEIEWEEQGRSF